MRAIEEKRRDASERIMRTLKHRQGALYVEDAT
jgi:hypothetical protein